MEAVNCHHNYVSKEHHFGEEVYVSRKRDHMFDAFQ
jgi:tRNA-splicing ligase RtcB